MTEKRYSFNWERGHPNFWDNYCDLADCYLTCEDVVKRLNEFNDENEQLKQSIYIMGGRLQGLWANYNANRWGIWSEAIEDIANELGFKIHHAYDDPISNSKSKKERVEGVKKITEILGENELIKKENKELKQFKQNVFGLIDKSLEKDKHDYEMTYEDYLNGRIEVLEDLKKELEE